MRRKARASGPLEGSVATGAGPRSAAAGSRRAVIRQAGSYGQWARPRNLARSPGGSGDWGCSRKRRSLAARKVAVAPAGSVAAAARQRAHRAATRRRQSSRSRYSSEGSDMDASGMRRGGRRRRRPLAHGGAGLRLRRRLGQVADLGEAVLVGRRLRDHEAVLVGRSREVEDGDAPVLETSGQLVGRRLGVGGSLAGAFVDELECGRCVLGEDVDLARLEGREDDLPVAELELLLDFVAVGGEGLGEQLAQDLLLVEVRRADDDLAL